MSLPSGKYHAVLLRAKRVKGKQLLTVDLVLVDTGERDTVMLFMSDVSHVLANSGLKRSDSRFEYLQQSDPAPVMAVNLLYSPCYTSSRVTSAMVTGAKLSCDIKMFEVATDFVEF